MTGTEQFTEDPALTGIAIAYQNPAYALIADQVMPRVEAPSRQFKYTHYPVSEGFLVPNTRIGRRSQPNKIEIEGEQRNGGVEDYGIDIPLDNVTVREAEANGTDPRKRATERSMAITTLDRELRVAAAVSNAANYPAANVTVLSGTDQLGHASSDPKTLLEDTLLVPLMRPNTLVMGQAVWTVLRRHPKIVQAVKGTVDGAGTISRVELAELLEIQTVLVGASRVDTARPGLAVSLSYCWGDFIAGLFLDPSADLQGGMTWGFSPSHGTRIGGTLPANIGVRGGVLVRAAESLTELVIAPDCGFLLSDCLA